MSMVKHRPADDLPWDLQGDTPYLCTAGSRMDCVRITSPYREESFAGDPDVRATMDYIAHTGNAYPKLVEALRELAAAAKAYDASIFGRAQRGAYDLRADGSGVAHGADLDALYLDWLSKANRAQALLGALGEDS